MHVPCYSNHPQMAFAAVQTVQKCQSHLNINYQAIKPQKLNILTLATWSKKKEREFQQSRPERLYHGIQDRSH